MGGRRPRGTILERMHRTERLQEVADVLNMLCDFMEEVVSLYPEEIEWCVELLVPITSETLETYIALDDAYTIRSQSLKVTRAPWSADSWTSETFPHYFRFSKKDFGRLRDALELGEGVTIRTPDRATFTGEEGLLVLLCRLAYPNRWGSLATSMFPAQPGHLCALFLVTLQHVDEKFAVPLGGILKHMPLDRLNYYAQAVQSVTGTGNSECIGFIDGTFRKHARPHDGQRAAYNGHYRGHGFKFICVTSPDGISPFYYGPIEGSRHDSYVLSKSGLQEDLQEVEQKGGERWHVYGDAAFANTRYIQSGYSPSINRSQQEMLYTFCMNSARICVEWGFKEVASTFKYVDYATQLKVFLSPVAAGYRVAQCLRNMKTCLEGNQTTGYFRCTPPTLEEYISWRDNFI